MEKYLDILLKQNLSFLVEGFWEVKEGYVFKLMVPSNYIGCAIYLVKHDGTVIPTNPVNTRLTGKYTKIEG